jgi:hypothetical protein
MKRELKRFTFDMDVEDHRWLKMAAAYARTSMREVLLVAARHVVLQAQAENLLSDTHRQSQDAQPIAPLDRSGDELRP